MGPIRSQGHAGADQGQAREGPVTTLANPRVRERLAKVDTTPSFAPGPALRGKLENEITNWSRFIDAKGIKAQ